MEKTPDSTITCYIGLTIVNYAVLNRINDYEKKLGRLFKSEERPLSEVHITLVPPFNIDYETASKINLGCATSTLQRASIINSNTFSMRGLDLMSFEGDGIVHFPILVKGSDTGDFLERVQAFRQKLKKFGAEIRQPVPENYTPHISVFTKRLLSRSRELNQIIKESLSEQPLFFQASYPTLYAKYKGVGYGVLSDNPNK